MGDMPPLEMPRFKGSRVLQILLNLCCVFFMAFSLYAGVCFFLEMIESCRMGYFGWALFELLLSAGAFRFAGSCFFGMDMLLSHLTILPEGVRVKYPLRKAKLHPWEAFQQVCICYPTSKPGIKDKCSVLCFVMRGEKRNIYDRWKTDMAWHVHSLITVDYTEALHEAVQARCPMEIVDLRNTIPYR